MARIFLKLTSLLMPSVLRTGTLGNKYSFVQHESHCCSVWRCFLIQIALAACSIGDYKQKMLLIRCLYFDGKYAINIFMCLIFIEVFHVVGNHFQCDILVTPKHGTFSENFQCDVLVIPKPNTFNFEGRKRPKSLASAYYFFSLQVFLLCLASCTSLVFLVDANYVVYRLL